MGHTLVPTRWFAFAGPLLVILVAGQDALARYKNGFPVLKSNSGDVDNSQVDGSYALADCFGLFLVVDDGSAEVGLDTDELDVPHPYAGSNVHLDGYVPVFDVAAENGQAVGPFVNRFGVSPHLKSELAGLVCVAGGPGFGIAFQVAKPGAHGDVEFFDGVGKATVTQIPGGPIVLKLLLHCVLAGVFGHQMFVIFPGPMVALLAQLVVKADRTPAGEVPEVAGGFLTFLEDVFTVKDSKGDFGGAD